MSDKTDTERLDFLIENDAFAIEHEGAFLVFRWNQYVDNDRLGEGATAREAIDNAIDNDIAEESRRRAEAEEVFRRRFPGSFPGS